LVNRIVHSALAEMYSRSMITIVLHNLHRMLHLNCLQRHNLHKRLQEHLEQVKRPEADMAAEAEQHRIALQIVPAVEVPLEVPPVSSLAELPSQWAERPLGLPEVAVVLADALLVLSVEILVEVGFAEHEPLFSDSCS